MRKALIFLIFTILSLSIQAQNEATDYHKIIENGQEYYLYEVQESEGFMAIGRKFGVAYQDIIELNKETTKEGLKVGQIIRIPVIEGRNSSQEELKSDNFIYHKVAADETLFFISRKYGVAIKDIINNNPGSDSVLSIGQELKIPKITEDAIIPTTKPKKTSPLNPKKEPDYQYHIVQPQETAYGIARKYKLSIAELAAANPGLESSNLAIGTRLRIPEAEATKQSSQTSEELSDTRYTYHRIKNGETLVSIAHLYQIPTDVIVQSNAFGDELPPVGYMLKIPHSYTYSTQIEKENQVIYTVKRKDDIREIAERYQVPIMDIKAANPDVKKWTKLKKGTQLIIPMLKVEQLDSLVSRVPLSKEKEELARYFETQKASIGDTINVAILWPLYLKMNDTINTIKKEDPDTHEIIYKTRNPKVIRPSHPGFREFYFGALLALNDLKEQGICVKLMNYDTEKSVVTVLKLLQDSALKTADLIIGPAYPNHARAVSEFSLKNHIRLVMPFLSDEAILESNPYLYQIAPTQGIQYAHIAQQVAQRYGQANIILVKSLQGDERQTLFTELLKSELYHPDSLMVHPISYKEIDFNRDRIEGLSALLDHNRPNLIIIPDQKEKLYTRVVPVMENYVSRHPEIDLKLLGFSEWQGFELSELASLFNVGCELYSPTYANLFSNDPDINHFKTQYLHYFKTLPTEKYPYFGMLGYDVTSFFVKGLSTYGHQIEGHLDQVDYKGLCVDLNFERINNWGGFVNKTMYTIEYTKDYEIKLIEP